MIIKQVDISITLTADELAREFWNMDHDEQAAFFNSVGEQSRIDSTSRLDSQMQYASESQYLDEGGRKVMETIGTYSRISLPL